MHSFRSLKSESIPLFKFDMDVQTVTILQQPTEAPAPGAPGSLGGGSIIDPQRDFAGSHKSTQLDMLEAGIIISIVVGFCASIFLVFCCRYRSIKDRVARQNRQRQSTDGSTDGHAGFIVVRANHGDGDIEPGPPAPIEKDAVMVRPIPAAVRAPPLASFQSSSSGRGDGYTGDSSWAGDLRCGEGIELVRMSGQRWQSVENQNTGNALSGLKKFFSRKDKGKWSKVSPSKPNLCNDARWVVVEMRVAINLEEIRQWSPPSSQSDLSPSETTK